MTFWHPCQSLLEINSVTRRVRSLSTPIRKLTVIASEKPHKTNQFNKKLRNTEGKKTKTSQSVITK
jgi:hypothetical protein